MATPMNRLPVELVEAVLLELSYPDLGRTRDVCKSMRSLCNSTVIPLERRKLVELRTVAASDASTALIRKSLKPFYSDFSREEYLERVGGEVPAEFMCWVRETPVEDVIGWHWIGLKDEYKEGRYKELGLDYTAAMIFSKNLKPGFTLLPMATVMEVEDPDYSENNHTDHHFYPGSWQCQRVQKETRIRALQIWTDKSAYVPKFTVLILSGSDRWDGHVWLVEPRSPLGDSADLSAANTGAQLIWLREMGTWIDYLKSECRELHARHRSMGQMQTFRPGLSGRMVWNR